MIEILTQVGIGVGIVLTTLTSVLAFYRTVRLGGKVEEVHVLVNSQLTEVIDEKDALQTINRHLVELLRSSGVVKSDEPDPT